MILLEALEGEQERLQEELEKVRRAIKDFGGKLSKGRRRKRRTLSVAARAKISAAQKLRWSKTKKA